MIVQCSGCGRVRLDKSALPVKAESGEVWARPDRLDEGGRSDVSHGLCRPCLTARYGADAAGSVN